MVSNTFSREEHLKSRKQIQTLFRNGKAFSVFPIKICYLPVTPGNSGIAQVGFSAPSRSFKKAVHRNRIKRLMREVYRIQKHDLLHFLQGEQLHIAVFFIYTGREIPDFHLLSQKMLVSLKMLEKKLRKDNTPKQ